MQPYLSSARRYRWVLVGILAILWGSGLLAAYVEYKTTYEARATIWVVRAAADLAAPNADDPSVPLVQTAASQQVDLINQLLQTRSFLADVIGRTALRTELGTDRENALLDDVRRHFHAQSLGPNMLVVSFSGRSPTVAVELVKAALEVRQERLAQTRIDTSTALSALYQREFEVAQGRVADAQRALDEFNSAHRAPLSDLDQHQQAQLRLALDLAQVRVSDLQGRMDRSVLAPALLEISGMEFQIVDPPTAETTPSGGARPAMTLAGVALAAGVVLVALLVFVGGLLANHVSGPADVGRLAPATLFASIPRLGGSEDARGELRSALAATAFSSGEPAGARSR